MGLIKAAFGSAGGVLADQWKEFFYCDALDKNTLVVRGQKKTTRRSSNTKGNDNVISNGSGIAVADGQCMIIVDQGKVAEVCAEPGEFTWDSSSEPSVFTGKFGDSLKKTFTAIGKRFSYGGDPGKDQRVYYFNTKEILDNKFGTATPIDFRVVDSRVGIDRDVRLRVNGTYSYRISDPILFYTNVCGNVAGSYERSELDGQLKTEFVSALMPAVGRMSELELRPNQLMNHTKELRDYLNQELTAEWAEKRGLSVVSVALGGVTLSEEDAELLRQDQRAATYRDPGMAAGMLATAQAEAMRTAAGNTGGAMTGFMGMGMPTRKICTPCNSSSNNSRQHSLSPHRRRLPPPTAGSAPVAGRPSPGNSVPSAVPKSRKQSRLTVGSARNAERPRQANSAPNAARHARRTMAGSAPAARITRGDSAPSAAPRSRRLPPATGATSAVGCRRIRPTRLSSARSAAIASTRTTSFADPPF